MLDLIDAARQPVVFAKDGEAFANSFDVATFFEKDHRNVLQAIDNLLKSLAAEKSATEIRAFSQTERNDESQPGRSFRSFVMTRDGFTLLAMGFTGAKALKWKLRYIEAFNTMEAELRSRKAVDVSAVLSNPAALRGLLADYTEKVMKLQGEVEEMRPSVQALDRIANTEGSMSVTEAAKTLQVQPKQLFGWLRSHEWIYRRPGSSADLAYQSRLITGVLEHKTTLVTRGDGSEKTVTQVRITSKGLTRLAKELHPAQSLF